MNVTKKDTAQALAKALERKQEAFNSLRRAIEDKSYNRAIYWFDQVKMRSQTVEDIQAVHYCGS